MNGLISSKTSFVDFYYTTVLAHIHKRINLSDKGCVRLGAEEKGNKTLFICVQP